MSTSNGKAVQLTERQAAMLEFIQRRYRQGQLPPSYEEFMDELGITSKGVVSHNLKRLEVKQFIRLTERKHHGIALVSGGPTPAQQIKALLDLIDEAAADIDRKAGHFARRDPDMYRSLSAIAASLRESAAEATGAQP